MSLLDRIRSSHRPFLIAEIGVNYYDIARQRKMTLMDAAKLMIDEAKASGADAAKFQTYKAGNLAVVDSPAFWDLDDDPIETQYESYRITDQFGAMEYAELARYCAERGIVFISTAFDDECIDYLDECMPAYKIASADINNYPLLRHVARKNKPVLLSTGASSLGEIFEAVRILEDSGNGEIALMHCVLSYPTPNEDAHLNFIKRLKALFPDKVIGYSDHTFPDEKMLVLTTAFLYGATILEKHFTLDNKLKGNDHFHAAEPADFKNFVSNIGLIDLVSGPVVKGIVKCEEPARMFARRSIVAKTRIEKGETVTEDRITYKRPGTGIAPPLVDCLLGRRAREAILADSIIRWSDIE